MQEQNGKYLKKKKKCFRGQKLFPQEPQTFKRSEYLWQLALVGASYNSIMRIFLMRQGEMC